MVVEPTHLNTISEIGSESFPQITVNISKNIWKFHHLWPKLLKIGDDKLIPLSFFLEIALKKFKAPKKLLYGIGGYTINPPPPQKIQKQRTAPQISQVSSPVPGHVKQLATLRHSFAFIISRSLGAFHRGGVLKSELSCFWFPYTKRWAVETNSIFNSPKLWQLYTTYIFVFLCAWDDIFNICRYTQNVC